MNGLTRRDEHLYSEESFMSQWLATVGEKVVFGEKQCFTQKGREHSEETGKEKQSRAQREIQVDRSSRREGRCVFTRVRWSAPKKRQGEDRDIVGGEGWLRREPRWFGRCDHGNIRRY